MKKRKRFATTRFEVPVAGCTPATGRPGAKGTKKGKPEPDKPHNAQHKGNDTDSRLGKINPRTHLPYKREAYGPRAAVREVAKGVLEAPLAPNNKVVVKLQNELASLAGKLAEVTKELKQEALARQQAELRLSTAEQQLKDAVAIAVKDEKIRNLESLHRQFMAGMQQGAQMARGDLTGLMQSGFSFNAAASSASNESPRFTPNTNLSGTGPLNFGSLS
jgi:hypothetical protein